MAVMDGKQCLDEILRINSQAKILIASGYAQNGPVPKAELVGARGFLEKPYAMRKLLQMVRRALDED